LFTHVIRLFSRFILQVGTIFGSSSGSTKDLAHMVAAEFGNDVAAVPLNIDGR
jgi:flavodoxin